MYDALPEEPNLPSREEVLEATKASPIRWNPLNVMSLSEDQSELSYREQRSAIDLGVKAIDN